MQKIQSRNIDNPEAEISPKSPKLSWKSEENSSNRKQYKYCQTFDTFPEMNTQNLLHSPNSSLFCSPSPTFCSPSLYHSRSYASAQKNRPQLTIKLASEKIKFQENCFRFKLKVYTILKSISPEDQNIFQLQDASPDVFISECERRLKNYVTETNRRLEEQVTKIEKLERKLEIAQRELNFTRMKLSKEEDLIKILKIVKKKQLEQYQTIFEQKDKKIWEYEQLLQSQEWMKARNKQNCSSLVNSISFGWSDSKKHFQDTKLKIQERKLSLSAKMSPLKRKQKMQEKKVSQCVCSSKNLEAQKKEKLITRDEYRFKMKVLIDQWRKMLYETVDYYEDKLKNQS